MQRIDNPLDWKKVGTNETLDMPSRKGRQVKLQVNCEYSTAFYIHHPGSKEPVFLARVEGGRDVILYGFKGPHKVQADQEFMCKTAEGEPIIFPADGEKFTKVLERREQDPKFEQMMRIMQFNMERRLAQTLRERDAKFEEELDKAKSEIKKTYDEQHGKNEKRSDDSKTDDTSGSKTKGAKSEVSDGGKSEKSEKEQGETE